MTVLHILKRHFIVFRRTFWANIIFNFVEPFLYLSALGLGLGSFVTDIHGMPYLQFIAPGMVAASGMWAATFECTYSSFIRLHYQKAFQAVLCAPTTVRDVVIGELLFGAFKSMVFGTIILVLISLWGQVQSLWALLIPIFLFLPGLVFSILALSYTGITPHIDYLHYYITLFITPMYLFSGIFFPVSSLPGWVQYIAWLSPVFHSVEVCRALALGNVTGILGAHIAVLLGLVVMLAWVPMHLFEKRLIN